jgi:hypothetical protein
MHDEVMAWRVVAYHLAGELGLRQDRVDEAVIALREVALGPSTAANVRVLEAEQRADSPITRSCST